MRAVKKDWIYSKEFSEVLNVGYKRQREINDDFAFLVQ